MPMRSEKGGRAKGWATLLEYDKNKPITQKIQNDSKMIPEGFLHSRSSNLDLKRFQKLTEIPEAFRRLPEATHVQRKCLGQP